MSYHIDAIPEHIDPDLFDNIERIQVRNDFFTKENRHFFFSSIQLKERYIQPVEIVSHHQIYVDLSDVQTIPTSSE